MSRRGRGVPSRTLNSGRHRNGGRATRAGRPNPGGVSFRATHPETAARFATRPDLAAKIGRPAPAPAGHRPDPTRITPRSAARRSARAHRPRRRAAT
ncbi:hypothetical protein [Tautonia rosea]|uniref:hypothetical protein n=1 Tax=Tautonia rosea TaxID=2728037 RepID=UPI0014737EE8|nr:hypothetical protein [Tautonia rosea]